MTSPITNTIQLDTLGPVAVNITSSEAPVLERFKNDVQAILTLWSTQPSGTPTPTATSVSQLTFYMNDLRSLAMNGITTTTLTDPPVTVTLPINYEMAVQIDALLKSLAAAGWDFGASVPPANNLVAYRTWQASATAGQLVSALITTGQMNGELMTLVSTQYIRNASSMLFGQMNDLSESLDVTSVALQTLGSLQSLHNQLQAPAASLTSNIEITAGAQKNGKNPHTWTNNNVSVNDFKNVAAFIFTFRDFIKAMAIGEGSPPTGGLTTQTLINDGTATGPGKLLYDLQQASRAYEADGVLTLAEQNDLQNTIATIVSNSSVVAGAGASAAVKDKQAKYLVDMFSPRWQAFAQTHFNTTINPVAVGDLISAGNQVIQHRTTLIDLVKKLANLRGAVYDGAILISASHPPPAEGTLEANLIKVINNINGQADPPNRTTMSAGAAASWIQDNLNAHSGPNATLSGQIQNNLTNAITAGENLNDQQKQNFSQQMFLYQQFYESAAALLANIQSSISAIARNIDG